MLIRVLECWCHVRENWSSGPRPLWGTPDTSPGVGAVPGCLGWWFGGPLPGALGTAPQQIALTRLFP